MGRAVRRPLALTFAVIASPGTPSTLECAPGFSRRCFPCPVTRQICYRRSNEKAGRQAWRASQVYWRSEFVLLSNSVTARAQSADAIQKYLAAHAQGCSLYGYEEYFRGSIPGMSQPVAVAAYTVEGCGGGNNWGRFVSAFYLSNGGVREFKHSAAGIPGPDIGDRRGATVRGDRMTVRYSDYAPQDPRCRPSLHKVATFRLVNGAISPGR